MLRIARHSLLWSSLVFSLVAAVILVAAPARASYPGGTGKIAFQSNRDGNVEIYAVNPDGTGVVRLTNNAATDEYASWSADGTKILFDSSRDGNPEIYSMNADGSGQTRITNNAAFDELPSLSPDGTKIVFDSGRDDSQGEIYTMNADGTNVVRLTNSAGFDFGPVWSPDGTKIVWQSTRTGSQLDVFSMNANGTSQTNLTNNAAADDWPNWSPDGTKIAFSSNRSSGRGVWQMNANGSSPSELLFGGYHAYGVSWRPDGKKIVWTAEFDTAPVSFNLVTSSAVTPDTDITQVTNSPGGVINEHPDWQPLHNTYARPVSATPLTVSLVPAFKECTEPQTTHRGAISSPSCNAPTPESSNLTIGSPEFNGAVANSVGSTKIQPFCNGGATGETPPCLTTAGDQLDGKTTVSITDVRCQRTSAGCSGGALSDYSAGLMFDTSFRITDRNNGLTGTGVTANATVVDLPVRFTVPCATTPSASVGSTCSITTSIDAVMGGNTAISEQERAIWQVDGEVKLYDGGADGVASTLGDNTLFAAGGVFFP